LLGLTCILLGRMDEGLRLLEDGVTLTEGLGVRACLALWTTHLGEGLLAAGQVERARVVAQRALELAQLHKERGHEGWALRLIGDIAAQERLGLGHTFIVARHDVELYEYLKQEFAGEPVTVMLDRRESDRRQQSAGPDGDERRQDDRRRNAEIQESLHTRGFVIVRES